MIGSRSLSLLVSSVFILGLASPAWAAQDLPTPKQPLVLAPSPGADWVTGALDLAAATIASGALFGLVLADGGHGTISSMGSVGDLVLLAGIGILPPAALAYTHGSPFALDAFLAGMSGGLVGLGLGFAATRSMGGDNPSFSDRAWQSGAMAVGQGVGAAIGDQLYQAYRPHATDLDRLPEHRTDDPDQLWKNLYQERKNP